MFGHNAILPPVLSPSEIPQILYTEKYRLMINIGIDPTSQLRYDSCQNMMKTWFENTEI